MVKLVLTHSLHPLGILALCLYLSGSGVMVRCFWNIRWPASPPSCVTLRAVRSLGNLTRMCLLLGKINWLHWRPWFDFGRKGLEEEEEEWEIFVWVTVCCSRANHASLSWPQTLPPRLRPFSKDLPRRKLCSLLDATHILGGKTWFSLI